MDSLARKLSELGWIEIDYSKPLNKILSIGDLLITTEMYLFDGYGDDVILNDERLKNIEEAKFTVLNMAEDMYVQMESDPSDGDDGWFAPEGRIFIKKQKLEYTTMQIPSFLVEKIKNMGGVLV